MRNGPVPSRKSSKRLGGQCDWQDPTDRSQYPMHAFQRPYHSAEHGQREETAQTHERGRRVRVAEYRDHKSLDIKR